MLPKFRVNIKLDQEVLTTDSKEVSGIVTSQYTYGKPVDGLTTVTLLCKGRHSNYRSFYYEQVGCLVLSSNASPVNRSLQSHDSRCSYLMLHMG